MVKGKLTHEDYAEIVLELTTDMTSTQIGPFITSNLKHY